METQDEVRLCEELELLFVHTEGQITLEEYHQGMEQLQKERERLFEEAGLLV